MKQRRVSCSCLHVRNQDDSRNIPRIGQTSSGSTPFALD